MVCILFPFILIASHCTKVPQLINTVSTQLSPRSVALPGLGLGCRFQDGSSFRSVRIMEINVRKTGLLGSNHHTADSQVIFMFKDEPVWRNPYVHCGHLMSQSEKMQEIPKTCIYRHHLGTLYTLFFNNMYDLLLYESEHSLPGCGRKQVATMANKPPTPTSSQGVETIVQQLCFSETAWELLSNHLLCNEANVSSLFLRQYSRVESELHLRSERNSIFHCSQ